MLRLTIIFLAFLFFGILQSTLFPANFLLILTVLCAINTTLREGFFWAFVAGIIRDLTTGTPLGLTSLFLLLLVFLLSLYGRKFKLNNLLYILPFTFLSLIASCFYFKQTISNLNTLFSLAVFLIMLPLSRVFFVAFEEDAGQLKLME